MSEWQPIETAPTYKEVLVWPYPTEFCMTATHGKIPLLRDRFGWYYSEYERGFGVIYTECCPTHWMPLPEPPKE